MNLFVSTPDNLYLYVKIINLLNLTIMAIRYIIRAIANPKKEDDPKKFYVQARALGFVDRNELLKQMVENTSLTDREADTALEYLFRAIPHFLKMGMTVQMGSLGYFHVTIQSEGSVNPMDAGPDKILRKCLKFVPGKKIREEINDLPVQKWFED
jgi:nucleoid DNA-binding protein